MIVLKAWEFPLGSAESRAAARAMLEAQERNVQRLQITHCVPRPCQDNSRLHVGDWQQRIDGSLLRLVYVPPNTDEETLRRILAAP